jgi:hypothetical protein
MGLIQEFQLGVEFWVVVNMLMNFRVPEYAGHLSNI